MEAIDKPSLNRIFYGPPGTGKTYHTIGAALEVCDETFYEANKQKPEALRERFNQLLVKEWDDPDWQIAFCTFHQSFSYEDFVEGIKPQTHVSKDGEEEVKQVTYEVQDGIFKLMCASARTGERGGAGSIIEEGVLAKANFYKVSLGQYNSPADDEIYAHCMANSVIAVGYGGSVDVSKAKDETGIKDILKGAGFKEEGEGFRYTVSVLRALQQDMKEGDIVFVSAGNSLIRAVGRISDDYFMDANAPIRFKQFRRVQWLLQDVEIPVEDIYPKAFVMGTLYSLDRNLVKKDYFRKGKDEPVKKDGRYALIIDEINRGNVASIFGELITLIEDDKREAGKEPARVKLPYSKDDFSVPSNLYLIGTMNTADRSVEALDTALRRRFSFVEMPSQPELVKPETVEGIEVRAVLTTINERVEQLMDKDHHIGHSYFMGLKTGNDLKRVFATKVIPLLEEYFHGDAKKVGAVLGEAFVEVRKKTIPFAKGFDMDEYEVKELFTVKDPRKFADLEPFKAIYASK
ncbi:MAG: AAA family ATPase [Flavobacteriales bacterium]|nr:AAA family ATPase [Flavobacteriales bacterium]